MTERRNLGDTLADTGDGMAIVDLVDPAAPRQVGYAELASLADGVARALVRDGVARGDRVGLLGQNSTELLAALLGIMRAGAVAVPINTKFPDATLEFVLADAATDFVFADERQAPRLPPTSRRLSLLPADFESFVDRGDFETVTPAADEIGLVLYTSGSTGTPKGVALSHASQWSMVTGMVDRMTGATATVAAPLYHMNGLLMSFVLLYGEGTIVLMPKFDARIYLEAIATHRVGVVTGVPTMLSLMARETDLVATLDLGCVKFVSIGSAPLSETVVKETQAMFPNARISNGYGTTEAGAGMFGPHPEGIPVPTMALGYPGSHVEVRLVGGASADEGVLEVKTPAAMNGYLNQPEKTAEKMSRDGFVNTGDIMRRDEHGFFYFVGRDDDMFVCSGENVFPGEVERVLERDPRISEACVVPVPDEIRGQIPVAFVTLSGEAGIDDQGVKQVALAGAPPYMHPRHVFFLDTMPLAGTNKIDRRLLQREAEARLGL